MISYDVARFGAPLQRFDRPNPVQVAGLTGACAVAAGEGHSLALRLDGTVWAWGTCYATPESVNLSIERSIPIQVPGLTDIRMIACGDFHRLARR